MHSHASIAAAHFATAETAPPPSGEVRRVPRDQVDPERLVQAVASGDERAAALLWDSYSKVVRGILRRSLGPTGDHEDLLQEVFIRLFRELHRLREPRALRSFLIGITLRVIAGERRRRRMRAWLCLTSSGTLPAVASDRAPSDPHHALTRLYEILDSLDDRAALAFSLRHIEGCELTDVAAAVGCSLATVKRDLARAQQRVFAVAKREAIFAPYLQDTFPSEPSR